jgi:hypothetical protein
MNNPETTIINVGDTPTLIFSGCGTVNIQDVAGIGYTLGNSSVAYNTTNANRFFLPVPVSFDADAELYAVRATGQSGNVAVTRYF